MKITIALELMVIYLPTKTSLKIFQVSLSTLKLRSKHRLAETYNLEFSPKPNLPGLRKRPTDLDATDSSSSEEEEEDDETSKDK